MSLIDFILHWLVFIFGAYCGFIITIMACKHRRFSAELVQRRADPMPTIKEEPEPATEDDLKKATDDDLKKTTEDNHKKATEDDLGKITQAMHEMADDWAKHKAVPKPGAEKEPKGKEVRCESPSEKVVDRLSDKEVQEMINNLLDGTGIQRYIFKDFSKIPIGLRLALHGHGRFGVELAPAQGVTGGKTKARRLVGGNFNKNKWSRSRLAEIDDLFYDKMRTLEDMYAILEEFAKDSAGPSPDVQRYWNQFRAIAAETMKKKKREHWAKRWQREIQAEQKSMQQAYKEFENERQEKEATVCDCGNMPYCSPVCARRYEERTECTCGMWPLCRVKCILWQANYHIMNNIWEERRLARHQNTTAAEE